MTSCRVSKVILLVIIFLAAADVIFAGEGDLDSTFGSGGIVTTDNDSTSEDISDLAVQPDGKIIAVGNSSTGSPSMNRATVVRYNSNGSLDSTFGSGGKVFIQSVSSNELALQSNGKIVLVGYSGESANSVFYIARLNSDGTFDTTFNGTGAVTLDLRDIGSEDARAVKVQPDGKIVVGGVVRRTNSTSTEAYDMAIVRLNPNGSLDATFDGDGIVFTSLQESIFLQDLAIQPDGKAVATGASYVTETSSGNPFTSFATVRYNSNGSVDNTFNGSGTVFTQFTSNGTAGSMKSNFPNTVIVRTSGKVLVVGTTASCCGPQPLSQVAMVQYNPDGSLDASFGTAGKTQFGFSTFATTRINAATIQTDNKIVVAALTQGNIKSSLQALVGRFDANGSPDPTFSGDGWNTPGVSGNFSSIAIQPNAKILAGGSVSRAGGSDFLLARFDASSCSSNCLVSNHKVADFDGDGRDDLSVFRSANGVWYLQQSTAGFTGVQFGQSGDLIAPADFDGDGKTDLAVFRSGVWYLNRSQLGFTSVQFGASGDVPAPADYDGDGKADVTVFRPSTGVWYLLGSTAGFYGIQFGQNGDKPVAADYDGDGRADLAFYRAGVWYLNRSTQGFTGIQFGAASDLVVPADYDGDGKTDLAVFRPSSGTWYLQQSTAGFAGIQFGQNGDLPAPADYDGDGKADEAVFRQGVWYLNRSTAGFVGVSFGISTDKPIPNAFVR